MNILSVLPGILTKEFCLLNLTHFSCSLRIISSADCGKRDVSQIIHSMSRLACFYLIFQRIHPQVVAQNRLPLTPINCRLKCKALHIETDILWAICSGTTNVMVLCFPDRIWKITRCIRHKVNRGCVGWWLLPPQFTELLLIPLAVWTHGEQLMGFCPANEIKRASAVQYYRGRVMES